MTQENKKCCEKCRYYDHPVKGQGFWCSDSNCPCHSPQKKKLSEISGMFDFPNLDDDYFAENQEKYGTEPTSRIYCEECGEKRTDTKDVSGYCIGHMKEHTPIKENDWKRDLNREFFGGIPMEEMGTNQVDEYKLQSFISNLLHKQREELVEAVEKLETRDFGNTVFKSDVVKLLSNPKGDE